MQISADRYRVSVVMERRAKRRGQWAFVEWEAVGILPAADDGGAAAERRLIHSDPDCERFMWPGFELTLFKDGAESYWNNLMAQNPSLFVVCRDRETDDGTEMEPFLVTANYDEIIGYQEVDDQVYSVPIPADIYEWLERYIVQNYVPPERKKRRRVEWKEQHGAKTAPSRRH
jgi:hypothetical protein